jgi:Mn2+/Fe2+ NRAMP family transporter
LTKKTQVGAQFGFGMLWLATAFISDVDWLAVASSVVMPMITWSADCVTAVAAVLGITISPCLFFWQASEEVEAQKSALGELPLKRAPEQAQAQMSAVRAATYFGMAVSNIIAFFIIVAAAAPLHAQGVHAVDSAAQAAQALAPIAGHFAQALFALGMVGTGLLAVPVLAGSSAYALGEIMQWKVGLERRPKTAKGFYAVIAVSTLIGIGLNLLHFNAMKALYWTAVINGVIAAPIMVTVMSVAIKKSVMGRLPISRSLRFWGWLSTLAMMGCALAVFLV